MVSLIWTGLLNLKKLRRVKHTVILLKLIYQFEIPFSSVAQSCLTLCDPMNHSTPGLPVHHQLLTLGLLKYPTLNRICVLQNFQLYCAKSLQSRLTLCDPMDCSPAGSCAHGTFQARILEWVDMLSSRGASQPRDQTRVSCIGRRILYHCATRKALQNNNQVSLSHWSGWPTSKNLPIINIVVLGRKGHSPTLLMGMQIGAATWRTIGMFLKN